MTDHLELEQLRVLRSSVALSRMDHVVCLSLRGEEVFDALDRLCPADLYLRDGQMLHTLLLRQDATPLADLYICRDDEDAILLAEGPGATELCAHLAPYLPTGVELERLDQTHALLGLNGPYAWELMAELIGPEVVGLPYLNCCRDHGWTCFRAGKTGEYGYDLLVPRDRVDELVAQVTRIGAALDLGRAGLDALDQCALENWFFNIRREGSEPGLTPVELQLQWRVSSSKTDYVGARALLQARQELARRPRLTAVIADAPLAAGDSVRFDDASIGRLLNAGFSPVRGDWVGLALLERRLAHPGINRFVAVDRAGNATALRTVSPPLIANRSLFINPQSDCYASRGERSYPPLRR
jgi:glycine cleavage system aminomethyltransferase T